MHDAGPPEVPRRAQSACLPPEQSLVSLHFQAPAVRPTLFDLPVTDLSFHLAPNAPWVVLAAVTLLLALLVRWAYRFAVPPIPGAARRLLFALRLGALVALLWLLAQPALERTSGGRSRVVILLDRSRSMDLPERPGGETRAAVAERAVESLRRSLGGRGEVEVRRFASALDPARQAGSNQARDEAAGRGATALGEALASLGATPEGQSAGAVVVVSDGVVNSGADPVAAVRALGVPVHAVVVGAAGAPDRAIAGVEASPEARVGQSTPVRVRVTSSEPRGTPLRVRIMDGAREMARGVAIAPGGGAEAEVELRVIPARAGLAVWTARVDSLAGEITTANDARQVALQVAPGRLGVLILSDGLNWDLTFLRRALVGDSSLSVTSRVRERDGWRALERPSARVAAPEAGELRGIAVVVLDAIAPSEITPQFDRALADFVRGGGGLLVLGGAPPGLARYRTGALGLDLGLALSPAVFARSAAPEPTAEAREITEWDSDPARGARAWRDAAPLSDLAPIAPGSGDRVVLAAAGAGPPLALARRIGRGQALLVNGTGLWRWSLTPRDDLAADRSRMLWRRWMRWLAEPVQGEPLRLRPERWLSAAGEPARLYATLQDAQFHPVAGAEIEGEIAGDGSRATRPVHFEAGSAGSYVADLGELPPGRWRVSARAMKDGREVGRASTELAVDRWSLEEARTDPDSAALAAIALASGGRVTAPDRAGSWARGLPSRALARGRIETLRLWESPLLFALVVGALGFEWAWRRRRGLP